MKTFHIQVWLARVPDVFGRHLDFFPACNVYNHVADLKVQAHDDQRAIEIAFHITQHGVNPRCEDWTRAPEVTFLHDTMARSSSVGDVFVLDGVAYGVHDTSFKPVHQKGQARRTTPQLSPSP